MTHDDETRFEAFEEKLRQLIERHEALKAENLGLRDRLADAEADLARSRDDFARLETSYKNLKASRVLEGIDVDDIGGTRERLTRLVREVDRCIALLNA